MRRLHPLEAVESPARRPLQRTAFGYGKVMRLDTSVAWWILLFVLASALLHIQAEYSGAQLRRYVFKPLTTSLIILFAALIPVPVGQTYRTLILIGLLFSLAGDIFLMLPQDRFVAGLVSFLAAHLAYIAAFISLGGLIWDFPALAGYALYGAIMLSMLWQGLGALRIPVLLYIVVILVMGWQALALWRLYGGGTALSAALGAAFFVVSDSILAYDRFRSRCPATRGLVLSTYFVAQTLIALSIAG